jgi:hypothetical protein
MSHVACLLACVMQCTATGLTNCTTIHHNLSLQMCADGGALSDAALQQLADADYSSAVRLEGGYAGWSEVGAAVAKCCFVAALH